MPNASEIPIIELNAGNIDAEHICCAISNTADSLQSAATKKAWMRNAFAGGYRMWRLDARGKAFIEGAPAEHAWCPVEAAGWFFLDCFWVSGGFKGQGVAARLLQAATAHARAQGMKGLVALAAQPKRAFLSDADYYLRAGFVKADAAPPDYLLLALPFAPGEALPTFSASVRGAPPAGEGVLICYSHHCPHTEKYVEILGKTAAKKGVKFEKRLYTSFGEAQTAQNPLTTWAMYYNGAFITNEIFSENKLLKFLENGGKV